MFDIDGKEDNQSVPTASGHKQLPKRQEKVSLIAAQPGLKWHNSHNKLDQNDCCLNELLSGE